MSLIPSDFINALISRIDIIELIDARVPLKKAGRNNYHACCPFHEEKTPSFTVSQQKQFYYCFGCGAGGNAIGFLMAYENLPFVEAVHELAKSAGMELPAQQSSFQQSQKNKQQDLYLPLQKASEYYEKQLKNSPKAIEYLKSRKLTGQIVKKFNIGFSPDTLSIPYPAFRGRIIFPIHDRRGRVIGFGGRSLDEQQLPKYLNSPDSPVFHKSNVLYGLYQARCAHRQLEKILIVEGYMDVVSLNQAGITFCAATLGTATTPQHISQLLQQTEHIIFCFDGDDAGRKAAWRALESALSVFRDGAEIRFLFLPDNEDPDSLINKEGKDKFLLRLENAQTLGYFFFQHLKSQFNIGAIEGRSSLAHTALPYLENISAPLFREIMINQLLDIVRLERTQLQITPQQAALSDKRLTIHRTPMRLAIALLLQHPSLVLKLPLPSSINEWTFKGSDLFGKLISLWQKNPEASLATILEYFRDQTNYHDLLYKLALWEHGVPSDGIQAEWKDILSMFKKKHADNKIERLLQKAHSNSLTPEEKIYLQDLLSKK